MIHFYDEVIILVFDMLVLYSDFLLNKYNLKILTEILENQISPSLVSLL